MPGRSWKVLAFGCQSHCGARGAGRQQHAVGNSDVRRHEHLPRRAHGEVPVHGCKGQQLCHRYRLCGLPSTGLRSSAAAHDEEDLSRQFTKAGALAAQYGGAEATELQTVQSAVGHASMEQAAKPLARRLARSPRGQDHVGTEHWFSFAVPMGRSTHWRMAGRIETQLTEV